MNDTRRYPDRPYIGVGAVVVDVGKVLIVKRKYDPLAGQWSIPGGGVELGETLEECVVREIREETGLEIEVGPVVEVLDRITRDEDGRVHYHFVVIDYLCWRRGGELRAGSDVDDVRFVDPSELEPFQVASKATEVITRALELERAEGRQPGVRGDRSLGPGR